MSMNKAYAVTYNRQYRANNPDYQREWRKRNPTRTMGYKLKRYNLTLAQRQEMVTAQEGNCALCPTPLTPIHNRNLGVVDHNHKTGKVRGIVHARCNTVIAICENYPGILDTVEAYLKN